MPLVQFTEDPAAVGVIVEMAHPNLLEMNPSSPRELVRQRKLVFRNADAARQTLPKSNLSKVLIIG
jgi:hypothetical protein